MSSIINSNPNPDSNPNYNPKMRAFFHSSSSAASLSPSLSLSLSLSLTLNPSNTVVKDAAWTKLETDHLVQLSLKYDLRWPVIKDRYKCTPDRPVQELQKRFYDVANRLQAMPNTVQYCIHRYKSRVPQGAGNVDEKSLFNLF